MKFSEKIAFYISVPKCCRCRERLTIKESVLCNNCKLEYIDNKNIECSVCHKTLRECLCVNKHLDSHFVHKLVKVFRYKPEEVTPENSLIYSLKRENRQDVVDFLASEMYNAMKSTDVVTENTIITSVPRRRQAIIKYGTDHAKELALAVSSLALIPYFDLLVSKAKYSQKKTDSPEDRILNAQYELKNENISLKGKTVILIDDIVTTGATMASCAFRLKELEPKSIIGAAISIAFRDNYTPFSTNDRFSNR